MKTLKDAMKETMQIMLDTVSWKEPEEITTGYPHFDQLVRGLRPGSLTVLASRPSLGKTAFALNIVRNLMEKKTETPLLYCSSLSSTELTFRLLTIFSGVTCSFDHDLTADESVRLTETVEAIRDYPLSFVDSRIMDDRFFRELILLQGKNSFGLILADSVMLEHLPRLKQLAGELEVPIFALVSVSQRDGYIPGSEWVDTVIHLHRDRRETKNEGRAPVSIVVSRNRFGLCGTCRMNFIPQTMRFEDVPDIEDNEDEQEETR